MFTTERLRLRAFSGEKDAENLLSLDNNALVAPLVRSRPIVPQGPKHKESLTEWVEKSQMFCIIEELDGEAFVGLVTFENPPDSRNRVGQFGISMLPQFWNKGYGKEVMRFMIDYGFRSLALHRISLGLWEGNDRAFALYRSLGFVEEGRQRKALWDNGVWKDTILMGLLEDEWAEKVKSETKTSAQ